MVFIDDYDIQDKSKHEGNKENKGQYKEEHEVFLTFWPNYL